MELLGGSYLCEPLFGYNLAQLWAKLAHPWGGLRMGELAIAQTPPLASALGHVETRTSGSLSKDATLSIAL